MLHKYNKEEVDQYHCFPPVGIRFKNEILLLKFAPKNAISGELEALRL